MIDEKMLETIIRALNEIPNTKLNSGDYKNTYEMVSELEKILDKREAWIDTIEGLWPIDSEYEDTNEIGKQLLISSIEENDWRALPDQILSTYAHKCLARDNGWA